MKLTKQRILHSIPLVILGICVCIVAVYLVRTILLWHNGHSIESDKVSNNVNVLLTRPDHWEKIETGQITLEVKDFKWIDGSTATIPITAELARQFYDVSDSAIGNYVDHNTTHSAYVNLMNPHSEKKLIFVTEPSQEELDMAAADGLTLDVTPIAMDGFVFITHKDNPVDSLTVEQVQQIYSGEITNWKEVGGNDAEIIPYQRERNSGSQTAMEQLVMQDVPIMEPAVGYRLYEITYSMGELIEKVAEYENRENSIGYTYYYYINNLYKNENIKVLSINGISPDNENLVDHSYPFTTAYYAVMLAGEEGKALQLRDYLLTEEGQRIIAMAGYFPVNREVQ